MKSYGRQYIDEKDIKSVVETLKEDYLTTGPKVKEFEDKICKYVNARYGIAVNSATSALDIAVQSLALPEGSEIITTAFTFAATSNSILYNNCKPVFADVLRDTYTIDPEEVKKKINEKTKAIICVDYAGHPCELDELKQIAREHNLILIEDASHSLGAEYKNQKIGSIADITIFSFHPVKPITTGEGGMIVTNNEKLAEKIKMLRSHGIDKSPEQRDTWEYDMKELGRNYRITDFQCALGISQLEKLNEFINKRNELANKYTELLKNTEIEVSIVKEYVKSGRHLFTILLKDEKERKKIYDKLRERGIGVNVHYIPIYKFTYYKKLGYNEKLKNTEEIYSRILSIPLHVNLTENDIEKIVNVIKEGL